MKHGHSDQRHIVLEFKKLVEPDWVGLQNPHNHLVVEEAFLRADPKKPQFNQLKRKKSDFVTSGFGDTSLGLGDNSGFLGAECGVTPFVVPTSLVLNWDKASCVKRLKKNIYEDHDLP